MVAPSPPPVTQAAPHSARALLSPARLAATALILIGIALTLGFQPNRLPFHQQTGTLTTRIEARQRTNLPASLRPGDIIAFAQQDLAARVTLAYPDVPNHHRFTLQITRDGQTLPVTLHTDPAPTNGPLLHLIDYFILAMTGLFALITLWRGTDWAAWGLSLFAGSILITAATQSIPLPPPFNILSGVLFTLAGSGLPIGGLYISALNLVDPPQSRRRHLNIAFIALLIIASALELTPALGIIGVASAGPPIIGTLTIGSVVLMVLMPVLLLAFGYVRSTSQQKLRLRWILVGTTLILPILAISIIRGTAASTIAPSTLLWLNLATALLVTLIFIIFAYAATSQRLIDVRIVVSRAMLVTALISLTVASLGASERLIVSSALGRNTSHALELGVALAVGVLFHQAQRRIERLIDRLFFWREHKARAALRDFVRDAGFIESPDILITRTIQALAARADAPACALFELRGTIMERSAANGARPYHLTLDRDDPALVRLRATRAPLDLHGLDSAIDHDGLALPLALRGRLFGVIVCAPRSASRYAQSEIDELAHAAHDLGAALFALRARANETLVEQLATGAIAPDRAIAQAQLLTGR